MKISSNTLSLLQNFATINPNILVKKGNKLVTRNTVGSVLARAVVEEDFPTQFAIYDLNQVLGLLSVSKDSDIDFNGKSMTIKSAGGGEIEYFYADESIIKAPSDTLPKLTYNYKFTLTPTDISTIQKITSLVSATKLSIIGDGKNVILLLNDPKNKASNTFKKNLGTTDAKFNICLSASELKVASDTYDVQVANTVGKNGNPVIMLEFKSTTRDLLYYIAGDDASKVK